MASETLAASSNGGLPLGFADAVYTERYMGKPSENSDSYKVSPTQANLMAVFLFTWIFLQFWTWKISTFVVVTELHSDNESKELQDGGLPFSSWHSRWYVQSRLAFFDFFVYWSTAPVAGVHGSGIKSLVQTPCCLTWALASSHVLRAPLLPADNVHFQQAAQISKALVEEQVDFEAMVNIGCWKWR